MEQNCYDMLASAGFTECCALRASARYLSRVKKDGEMESCIEKMKKMHRFVSGSSQLEGHTEQYTAAAFLAASGITTAEYMQRMCRMEDLMRTWMPGQKNIRLAVSMIPLFRVDDIALCERLILIYRQIKTLDIFYEDACGEMIMGLMSIIKDSPAKLAQKTKDEAQRLEKRGFPEEKAFVAGAAVCFFKELVKGRDGTVSQVAAASMAGNLKEAVRAVLYHCLET